MLGSTAVVVSTGSFVSAVLDGSQAYATAREGAYAVDFTEALYRSAAEGKIIRLDHV